MKKIFSALLIAALLLAVLSGCAKPAGAEETPEILEVDVDLTALSATVAYGEVFSMMLNPERYEGQTVKMAGAYAVYNDYVEGVQYHAVLISDAAACCAQGLEFVLTGGQVYPDDYPQEGEEIEIVGTARLAKGEQYDYLYIETDSFAVVEAS